MICYAAISYSLFFCSKNNNIETKITKIDMEEMADMLLPYFHLRRKNPKYIYGKEYVFVRKSDSVNLFITIGLHQSGNAAESTAIEYISDISAHMEEGSNKEISIGNKFWWWAPDLDFNNLNIIIFIRKNALFIISSHSYSELNTLATKIDDDIINNSDYIQLENTILLPVIDSITASKTELKEGDTTKITVHASDPNNEPLEFSAVGLSQYESDPENVFTEVATIEIIISE